MPKQVKSKQVIFNDEVNVSDVSLQSESEEDCVVEKCPIRPMKASVKRNMTTPNKKVEVKQPMKTSVKEKPTRKPNAWNLHMSKVAKQNPDIPLSQLSKLAKETYNK